MSGRTVHCTDAVKWLESQPILEGCSLLSSIPDASEFPKLTLNEWKQWFIYVASLVLSRCPKEGVSIFCQTDIRQKNEEGNLWVDKGYLCQKAAEIEGQTLLWQKIICRSPVGKVVKGTPSYSRLLCFSKSPRIYSEKSADVIPVMGEKTWARGMGINTCFIAGKFIANNLKTSTLVHPFCGQGAMLAVANYLGLSAVGIELNSNRASVAKTLKISSDGTQFLH